MYTYFPNVHHTISAKIIIHIQLQYSKKNQNTIQTMHFIDEFILQDTPLVTLLF